MSISPPADAEFAAVSVNFLVTGGAMQCYGWEASAQEASLLIRAIERILGPPMEGVMTSEGTAEMAEVVVRTSASICSDPCCEG